MVGFTLRDRQIPVAQNCTLLLARSHIKKKKEKTMLSLFNDVGDNRLIVPLEVCHVSSSLRPDIFIYSFFAKRALILELTCPNEDRFETSHVLIEKKYLKLIIADGFDCNIFTIEVGVLGIGRLLTGFARSTASQAYAYLMSLSNEEMGNIMEFMCAQYSIVNGVLMAN